jgi:dCTP deaminase
MIMSDGAIWAAVTSGEISIEPNIQKNDVRSVGLRLYLGEDLLIPAESNEEIDLTKAEDSQFISHKMGTSGYLLESHSFVLACTRERIKVSRSIVCRVDGRSSVARSGLFVHCSSTTVDNIHDAARTVILELFNCNRRPVRLWTGLAIAMLIFERVDGEIQQKSSLQYADQQRLIPPRPSSRLQISTPRDLPLSP